MSAANRRRAAELVDGFLTGARSVDAFVRRVERELDAAEARGYEAGEATGRHAGELEVARDAMTDGGDE